jgi:hypothetical protein
MNTDELDQQRRAVRDAVFRAGRLRLNGQTVAADELLASELHAAQAHLGATGVADAAPLVHQWYGEDEATFALAHLISELVGDRLQSSVTPRTALAVDRPSTVSTPATPPHAGSTPGLADLLDGMLTEERRAKRHPS